MKRTDLAIAAAALASVGIAAQGLAQSIRGPVQIASADTTLNVGDGRFPLNQIRDGVTEDNGRNGFVGGRGQLGMLSFRLDQPYDIDRFLLWNDISVRAEGIENFTLRFFSGQQLVHSQRFAGRMAAKAGMKEVQSFPLSLKVEDVDRVELQVESLLDRPNTYAVRVEIREVAFSGAPSSEREETGGLGELIVTTLLTDEDDDTGTEEDTEDQQDPADDDGDEPVEAEDPLGPLEMRNRAIPDYEKETVLFFSRAGFPKLREIAAENGLQIREFFELDQIGLKMASAKIEADDSVENAVRRLTDIGIIEWAEPNAYFQLLNAEDAPRSSRETGLDMHGLLREGAEAGSAPLLPDATIVLIDSPVDLGNAALAGANIEQLAVDVPDTPSPHGTIIAELLVGTGDFKGVAENARLVSFAAFEDTEEYGFLSSSEKLAKALNASARLRPHALNLSFGSGRESRVMEELLQLMEKRGTCVAAAAGNDENAPVLFPANSARTLAVTAVNQNRDIYDYASRGDEVDIAAWGVAMNAAVPGGRRVVSGTSFATALVSGSMLRMPACVTGRDPAIMRAAIAQDAEELGAPGVDPVFGAGLFRLGEASLKEVAISRAPPPETQLPDPDDSSLNPAWLAAGGAGAAGGIGLFFLAWRRKKKKQAA